MLRQRALPLLARYEVEALTPPQRFTIHVRAVPHAEGGVGLELDVQAYDPVAPDVEDLRLTHVDVPWLEVDGKTLYEWAHGEPADFFEEELRSTFTPSEVRRMALGNSVLIMPLNMIHVARAGPIPLPDALLRGLAGLVVENARVGTHARGPACR